MSLCAGGLRRRTHRLELLGSRVLWPAWVRRGIQLVATLSITLVLGLLSQPALPSNGEIPSPTTAILKFPVWVLASLSDFQTQLAESEFSVQADDSKLKVLRILSPDSPTFLFVALDMVGDIANMNQARRALQDQVKSLGSQYWVSLISAQEQINVLQDPTPDHDLLVKELESFSQIGKAGLLESVERVAALANGVLSESDVRVAVIFVTDSDIGNYRTDYLNPTVNYSDARDLSRRFAGRALQEKISRMTAALARYQAPIFIVHIDPGRDPLNQAYLNGLKQFAEISGGQLFLSRTPGEIPVNMQEAFRWVQNAYVVDVEVPQGKEGSLKLKVTAGVANERNGWKVSYPARLYVPDEDGNFRSAKRKRSRR
ncbi:MAG: hypothetical protein AB1898_08640 [Acidobacteriota bacterium]